MSVRVLRDCAGEHAVLYDSVSMVAFGPVFDDCEFFSGPESAALAFLAQLDGDPRDVPESVLVEGFRVWRERVWEQVTA